MTVPVYADVTSLSLEKSFYTIDENIKFVGTQNGTNVVFVVIHDANGNYKDMLAGSGENEFTVIPRPVSNIFEDKGIHNATAFTDKQKLESGFTIRLEFDGEKVFVIPDFVLELNSISDKTIKIEKTITFTASLRDSSVSDVIFSLKNEPMGATIDQNLGKFVWTPSKSHGSYQDVKYNFDIIATKEGQEDIESITITVEKAYVEPEIKSNSQVPEPEIQRDVKESKLASFVDETKDPQSYVDRYNNEIIYKEWFDENYIQYSSIYEAVGLEESVVIEPEFGECGEGTKLMEGKCIIIESKKAGGGCLIATATYGSEMSTQVQQLREIRDNQLLNTESGIYFINLFNDVYYSFSPIIADYERENPLFKEVVKLFITPMISSLSIMSYADSDYDVLGLGIGVILMNLGMYLVSPVMLFYVIKKIKRVKF
jgi:hypothetical protein